MPAIDVFKNFVGDLARPISLIAVGLSTAWVIWTHAPADIIGASGVILVALYGTKALENVQTKKQDASVQIAQAQGTTTP